MHTIKPIDADIIKRTARASKAIFTLEEHSVIGGLGSAVSEILCEKGICPKHFIRFGVKDKITSKSGNQDYLRSLHGLLPGQIAEKIIKVLK